MKVLIENLEINIKQRFPTERNYWYFEITDVIFGGYDNLQVSIGHHSDKEFRYKLSFSAVYSSRIIQESYYPGPFSDEDFLGCSFLQTATISRYKNDLLNNTLLGDLASLDQKTHKIKTFRLITQNNIIDVLSEHEPVIEYVETGNQSEN